MRCFPGGHENSLAAKFCIECGVPLVLRCASCQATLTAEVRFCPACGTTTETGNGAREPRTSTPAIAGDAALVGERRQLTVLFCDLVGSTTLAQQLDAEDWREILARYHAAAAGAVTRWGGHVAKHLGDGILVYFGWPSAREDDPEQAVHAGLAILEAVAPLNGALGLDDPNRLAVRIGMHTGPVVIADRGEVFGETAHIAARVQGAAEPDSVLITAATRRLIAGRFVLQDQGPRPLKGVREPVVLYRVVRASRVRSRLDLRSLRGLTPLVGRAAESELLVERWAQARDGRGQAVLVSGEPGIGKSRLVRVLREHMTDHPHRWLEVSCSLYMRNTAFQPIVELLEQGLGFHPADQPAERLRRLEDALRVVGLTAPATQACLASLLSLPHASEALAGLSPVARRRTTFDGLVEWAVASSEREPVVLLVEDLHWCDPSTLELLNKIVERMATARILMVLTYRPDPSLSWPAFSHVSAVTLDRMSGAEASEIVRQVIARWDLPDTEQQHIVDRAEGNPLFIEELTKMMIESQRPDAGATPEIPATLQGSLLARLDRLGPAKQIAQVAAVIGREFSYELLHLVARRAHAARGDEAELRHAIGRLLDAGLVVEASSSPPTYAFKHALVQEAAYQSLLKRARRELHAHIVHVLREHFPERIEAQSEMAARHAEAAGLVDDAIALYQHAARQAAARSAHEEALLLLRRALDVVATEPQNVVRDRRETGLQRALAAELIAARGYGHPETATAWQRMRTVAHAAGERRSYGEALLGLALCEYALARFEPASVLIDEGLAVAEQAGDVMCMVAAHNEKTTVAYFQGRFRAALEHAERAIAWYDPARDHRALVTLLGDDAGVAAHATSGWALFQLGYPDRALARVEEALRLAESLGDPFSIAQASAWRVSLHMERGDDMLRERAAEALRFSEAQGFPLWCGAAKMWLGYAEGDPAMLLDGLGMTASSGTQAGAPVFFYMLAHAYRRRELYADALATIDGGLAASAAATSPYFDGHLHRLKGEIVLVDGARSLSESRSVASECFQHAIEIARGQEAKSIELRAANALARLRCSEGRHEEARALLAPLYAWFGEGLGTRDLLEAQALLAELGA